MYLQVKASIETSKKVTGLPVDHYFLCCLTFEWRHNVGCTYAWPVESGTHPGEEIVDADFRTFLRRSKSDFTPGAEWLFGYFYSPTIQTRD